MREVLRNLVLKLVGCPYIWGGQNPWTGFDCSGFVVWVFQVFGLLPSGDWTAAGLYRHLLVTKDRAVKDLELGDTVFYGLDVDHITHVMVGLGGGLVVGDSGGGHTTTTVEEARRIGAQVKVKPVKYRADLVAVLGTGVYFEPLPAAKAN
jgi:cell wall-associated NlpC family hydrolase